MRPKETIRRTPGTRPREDRTAGRERMPREMVSYHY